MEERGMINEYRCGHGHVTRTGNLDAGVTPFMIDCKHPGCHAEATSCFYRCDQTQRPEWVWYMPTDEELHREFQEACVKLHNDLGERFHSGFATGLKADMLKHKANGGLSLRRCKGPIDLEQIHPRFRTRFA